MNQRVLQLLHETSLRDVTVFFFSAKLPVKQIFRSIDVELYTVVDWYITEKAICD